MGARRVAGVAVALVGLTTTAAAQPVSPARASASARAAVISPMPVAPEVVARDEEGHVTIRATRLTEKLVVDGRLDEDIYRTVRAIEGFVQQQPNEGAPAHERTEAWVFFDDDAIYISAFCHQAPEQKIVANDMRRDGANIFYNDNFGIILDTFHDRRNGFLFQTNPVGGLQDVQVTDETNYNRDWNTVWNTRSRIVEGGWVVEVQIPFKSLRFPAGREQVWGINLRRIVQARGEHSFVTQLPASALSRAIARVSLAATLVGLEIGRSNRTFEVKPYAISTVETNRTATPEVNNHWDPDAGVDAKVGVTSGINADLTWNTDFSQVEEDELQANLTRFNLFFPERRDFFLEGAGMFQFGGVISNPPPLGASPDNTPILFFSRRIGLEKGLTVPIQGGGRVTGRSGRYTLGGLFIRTDESAEAGTEATGFGVVRVKRDISRRGYVGVIGTHRSVVAGTDHANDVFGVDAQVAPTQELTFLGYVARSWTPGLTGDESSYRARVEYAADQRGLEVEFLNSGAAFTPEVGFLRRRDFKRSYAMGRLSPRFNDSIVRKAGTELSLEYITDGDLVLESRLFQVSERVEFANGDTSLTEYEEAFEAVESAFEVDHGLAVPPGVYRFRNLRTTYALGPNHKAYGNAVAGYGSFYDGTRAEMGYKGRIEVTSQLSVEPNLSVNRIILPAGESWLRVLGGRVTATISPRLAVSALVQFSSRTQTLGSSARLRWEYHPGSDLYVVYTDGRATDEPGSPRLQSRSFAVKITRLFRF